MHPYVQNTGANIRVNVSPTLIQTTNYVSHRLCFSYNNTDTSDCSTVISLLLPVNISSYHTSHTNSIGRKSIISIRAMLLIHFLQNKTHELVKTKVKKTYSYISLLVKHVIRIPAQNSEKVSFTFETHVLMKCRTEQNSQKTTMLKVSTEYVVLLEFTKLK